MDDCLHVHPDARHEGAYLVAEPEVMLHDQVYRLRREVELGVG